MRVKVLFFFSVFFLSLLVAPCVRSQLVWQTESSTGFTPRDGLTSAVVNDKIYVMGGEDDSGNVLNTMEVFDPVANTWSTPVTSGTFTPRDGLTSQVVDGKIYVMGGFTSSGVCNTLEVFDPTSNSWSTPETTGNFTPRGGLISAVVGNKIYVMCGFDGRTPLNTMEVFDPNSNTWTTPITFGVLNPRFNATADVVNGKIYVMNGNGIGGAAITMDVYDTSTMTWSTLTTGFFTHRTQTTSAVVDGKICVLGGFGSDSATVLSTLEVFDPSTSTWSTPVTAGIFIPRTWLTSDLINGNIYALGGSNDSGYVLNANEVLTFDAGSVTELGSSANAFLTSYPNPITDRATISFNLPERTDVSVEIHDELGRLVSTLANEEITSGPHQLTWQPESVAAGSYVCTLKSVHLNILDRCKLAVMR